MTRPLVWVSALGRRYRQGGNIIHALIDISVLVEQGEFVAILGRSGSGKSTLLGILGLLDQADDGYYSLAGRDVTHLDEHARAWIRNREIGFVFQTPALLPRCTALENVELPLIYTGVEGVERRRRSVAVLDRVGLSHRQDHWPHQLSGGEQQRVAIARALINDPALILADEPTGALDSKTGEAVLSLLEGLHREGHTLILVTHAQDIAERAARRITIHDGRVVEDEQQARTRVAAPPEASEAAQMDR